MQRFSEFLDERIPFFFFQQARCRTGVLTTLWNVDCKRRNEGPKKGNVSLKVFQLIMALSSSWYY